VTFGAVHAATTMTLAFTVCVSTDDLLGAVSDGATKGLLDRPMQVQLTSKGSGRAGSD
jgi:hypothetical protein